jgi:hypothetical protein
MRIEGGMLFYTCNDRREGKVGVVIPCECSWPLMVSPQPCHEEGAMWCAEEARNWLRKE